MKPMEEKDLPGFANLVDCLQKLALRPSVAKASQAINEIGCSDVELIEAMELLSGKLDHLIPMWIERFLEFLPVLTSKPEQQVENSKLGLISAETSAEEPEWNLEVDNIINALVDAIQAVREKIVPHIEPVIEKIGRYGDMADDYVLNTLEWAGPALIRALPRLFELLQRGELIYRGTPLSIVLVRASDFDERVLTALLAMLRSGDENRRISGAEIIGDIGNGASSAIDNLLVLWGGSDRERAALIRTLGLLGVQSPAVIDVLDLALRDSNVGIRCTAAKSIGELIPDPARFVPMLVSELDSTVQSNPSVNESHLREYFLEAISRYGPKASAALPYLHSLLAPSNKKCLLDKFLVKKAILRISGDQVEMSQETNKKTIIEYGQDPSPLHAVVHNGNQCYINSRGKIVLSTPYVAGGRFIEGRAVVYDKDWHVSVIDTKGEVVISDAWDSISSYSEGMAAVKKGRLWGFIDREGRIAIEPQFDAVTSFREGLAGFEVGRKRVRLEDGVNRIIPGLCGFIDLAGVRVIPATWMDVSRFCDGRALVCTEIQCHSNPLIEEFRVPLARGYAYVDRSGALVSSDRFTMGSDFSERLEGVTHFQAVTGLTTAA